LILLDLCSNLLAEVSQSYPIKSKSEVVCPVWSVKLTNDDRIKATDADKLNSEYQKLVEGLRDSEDDAEDSDTFMTSPRTLSFALLP
jgi:hypothetical protein